MYATLEQVRVEIKATVTADDVVANSILRQADSRVKSEIGVEFEPFYATFTVETSAVRLSSDHKVIRLMTPILMLSGFTKGSLVASVEDVLLIGYSQKTSVRMADGSPFDTDVTLTGIWGKNSNTDRKFKNSNVTLSSSCTDSQTVLQITNSGVRDELGIQNSLAPGAILLIEEELVEVIAVSQDTLTVSRAMNCSVAKQHSSGVMLQVWNTDYQLVRAVSRLCGYMYKRRAAFDNYVVDGATVAMPTDMPEEVSAILARLRGGSYASA